MVGTSNPIKWLNYHKLSINTSINEYIQFAGHPSQHPSVNMQTPADNNAEHANFPQILVGAEYEYLTKELHIFFRLQLQIFINSFKMNR